MKSFSKDNFRKIHTRNLLNQYELAYEPIHDKTTVYLKDFKMQRHVTFVQIRTDRKLR